MKPFCRPLKTILDSKMQSQLLKLTPEQRDEIARSKKQIGQGLFLEQAELEQEFEQWLNAK